jgi:hypothetical protein
VTNVYGVNFLEFMYSRLFLGRRGAVEGTATTSSPQISLFLAACDDPDWPFSRLANVRHLVFLQHLASSIRSELSPCRPTLWPAKLHNRPNH